MDEKKSGGSAGQEAERCHWSSADELHFLDYITAHKEKGGDGLNFDKNFWLLAATKMVLCTTSGAVKSAEACSQKWTRMHATFSTVDCVANFSGISWSNEQGSDITHESESVWVNLIRVCTYLLFLTTATNFFVIQEIPVAKSFRNKG
ncbi:hypothetical protein DFJ58DRAFT_669673 [Suillus subalutaceus]|uniref:uncharacterized protein n=1 Tax=Suillus subalutaceus TaxID=48586 RepID=UPI001B8804B8|nr:uncharacterized protein DFJ58DRAFT_669673 [Suillus subalutaceus]KAG1836440.1 hypothetical protein DFJ58DRAFT_669673 [Suillus subalutaceus]